MMKSRHLGIVLCVAWLGCPAPPQRGDGGPPDGAHADSGSSSAQLQVEIQRLGDGGVQFPFDSSRNAHFLKFQYRITIQNKGPGDLQDLRIAMPLPDGLKRVDRFTIEGGWYNDAVNSGLRYIDWLPPEMGPVRFNVSLERDPNIFTDDPSALRGEVELVAQVSVSQYDVPLAQSGTVSERAYLPLKISPQNFEFYSGWSDGVSLYLSARPHSGPHGGRGGVYRLDATDGGVSAIAQHAARVDAMAPFFLDGNDVYYVSFLADDGTSGLMKTAKDGSGTPSPVPSPDGGRSVLAVAADETTVFAVVEKTNSTQVMMRAPKAQPSQLQESANLGRCVPDTLVLTRNFVVVMREGSPSALLRISKSDLSIKELAEVGSLTGRRSIACSETHCFWTEWTQAGLYQVPIEGGEKTNIASTNQPLLFDGSQLYSGINGVVRVGPSQKPPLQRLVALGGGIPLLALDDNYVYFGHDGRVWRLHK